MSLVEAECAKAGVHPKVVLEMSSPDGILEAVAEGNGVTILPELYVRSRLSGGNLQLLEPYDPTPRHGVGVAFLTRRHRNLAAEEFARLYQTTIKELQSHSKASPVMTIRARRTG